MQNSNTTPVNNLDQTPTNPSRQAKNPPVKTPPLI
jgi:hypothetical protein